MTEEHIERLKDQLTFSIDVETGEKVYRGETSVQCTDLLRALSERDALAALVEEAAGVIKKARNFHIKERADFDEANATLAKIASMKGKE